MTVVAQVDPTRLPTVERDGDGACVRLPTRGRQQLYRDGRIGGEAVLSAPSARVLADLLSRAASEARAAAERERRIAHLPGQSPVERARAELEAGGVLPVPAGHVAEVRDIGVEDPGDAADADPAGAA